MLTTTNPARILQAADALRRVMAQLDPGQSLRLKSGAIVRRDSLLAWSFVWLDGQTRTGTIAQLVGYALHQRLNG